MFLCVWNLLAIDLFLEIQNKIGISCDKCIWHKNISDIFWGYPVFALIFEHFTGLFLYFKGLSYMHQRKEKTLENFLKI